MIGLRVTASGWRVPMVSEPALQAWLNAVGARAVEIARKGMVEGPHTGRIYRIDGRAHQASAPYKEYPARLTGAMVGSLEHVVEPREVTVGTDVWYSEIMRWGGFNDEDVYVEPRKMSDAALKEALGNGRPPLRRWIEWRSLG